jgi:hypothetical protein
MNPTQKGGDVSEYMYLFRGLDWIQSLSQQGQFIAGQPLQSGGKVVAGSARVITDGPFAEGKEIVGGYLIVRASDLPEAVEMSKGCPIFEHGGTVEVRAIQPLNL